MQRYSGEMLAGMLDGIVHEQTQIEPYGVTVTVATIERFSDAGALDFGGGEYEDADRTVVEPRKRSTTDEYGWWALDGGMYRVQFNESVTEAAETAVWIEPWTRAREAGIIHPRRQVSPSEASISAVIQVPSTGVQIKENARLSVLRAIR